MRRALRSVRPFPLNNSGIEAENRQVYHGPKDDQREWDAAGGIGHRSFAPALQIAVAALAIVSMPILLAAFDEYYGGSATVPPQELVKQVFVAQLLPLSLGMLGKGRDDGLPHRVRGWHLRPSDGGP
jgi:hypothetical protein